MRLGEADRGMVPCQDYELAEPPAGERFVALTGYGGVSCGLRHDGTFLCYPDVQGYPKGRMSCCPRPGKRNGSVPSAWGAGVSVLSGGMALRPAGSGTWYPTTMYGLMWTQMWGCGEYSEPQHRCLPRLRATRNRRGGLLVDIRAR